MLLRAILTVICAAVLGTWAYLDQKRPEGAYELLHSLPVALILVGLPILVGLVVRRAWALLALAGPLLSLGYLQVTGYISPWHDGVDPLLSPPGIAFFIWFGLFLVVGIGIGRAWEHYRPALRRRLAALRQG